MIDSKNTVDEKFDLPGELLFERVLILITYVVGMLVAGVVNYNPSSPFLHLHVSYSPPYTHYKHLATNSINSINFPLTPYKEIYFFVSMNILIQELLQHVYSDQPF